MTISFLRSLSQLSSLGLEQFLISKKMAFVPDAHLRLRNEERTQTFASTRLGICMSAKPPHLSVSRRSVLIAAAAVTVGSLLAEKPQTALAGELQPYKDLQKGFTMMRPAGWNEFEAADGQYDIKWQDVIQPLEFVTVLTTPVSKGKSLSDIGTVDKVGEKLASGRGGKLLAAVEMKIDDIPAYVLEIKKESAHQMTLLAVAKNKLYSLNVSAAENRWPRREKLLRSVIESFQPKL